MRAALWGCRRPPRCAGSPQSDNTPPLHPSWHIPRTLLRSSRFWAAASTSCNRWGRSCSDLQTSALAAHLRSRCRSPLHEGGRDGTGPNQREKEQTVKLQHERNDKDVQ